MMPDLLGIEQPQLERRQNAGGHECIIGIERGMVFWAHVTPQESRGCEQTHPITKPCPWLVLSSNHVHRRMPMVLAVPLSSKVESDLRFLKHHISLTAGSLVPYKLRAGVQPLRGDSLALTEQLRGPTQPVG